MLVILLHGVGSTGASMQPIAKALRDHLPNAVFECPDGPEPFDVGPGRQWFSVSGVTTSNRPSRITAARPSFDAVVSSLIAKHGFQSKLQQVCFLGFSQGTIMALDAVANGRWKIGILVGFAGRLAISDPIVPSDAVHVLLVHGTNDRVIPFSETTSAIAALKSAGIAAEQLLIPMLSHAVSAEAVAAAGDFLSQNSHR